MSPVDAPPLSARQQMVTWLSTLRDVHRATRSPEGWAYDSVEDLVLALGHWHTPTRLPTGHAPGAPRRCYANATYCLQRHRYDDGRTADSTSAALYYAEGFALTPTGHVFAHAWCVDDRARVHDPTWTDTLGRAYLGLVFTTAYLDTLTNEHPLLHEPHHDAYRILRTGPALNATAPIGDPHRTT